MSAPRAVADAVTDYLLAWVLLAVAVGAAVPAVAVVTRLSTALLAVMIGSISLTLSVDQFRGIDPWALGAVLTGHAAMPFLAFGVVEMVTSTGLATWSARSG